MQRVKYTGTADVRSIDAANFKRAGVGDQHKVVWRAPDFIAEVSDDAANFLLTQKGFALADQDEGEEKEPPEH